jgi:uncharacterized protein (TIGR02265 family)
MAGEAQEGGRGSHFIEGSIFEGLFLRSLKPDGPFAEELSRAGFDVQRPQPRYRATVWNACVEIARQRTQAHLSPEEGRRALGRLTAEGFFSTLVGSVIGVGLPLLGAEMLIKRLPRLWNSGTIGPRMRVTQLGPREWQADVDDDTPLPDVGAGLLEYALGKCLNPTRVEVVGRHADGYSLRLMF